MEEKFFHFISVSCHRVGITGIRIVLKIMNSFYLPGDLAEAIVQQFGTFENMKNQLSAVTTAVQGSGWGWLGYNKSLHKLQIATCANQDPLEATTGITQLNHNKILSSITATRK